MQDSVAEPAPVVALDAQPAPLPYARPDWATQTDDVRCPLCDYSLFRLEESRCPECGYRFEWRDLLDPTRRLHPYLYEHHPRRGFRSFWATNRHALRPRRFWSNLYPSQPSRPGRLLRYWFWVALLSVIPVALIFWYGGLAFGSYLVGQFSLRFTPLATPQPPASITDQIVSWLRNFRPQYVAPYSFLAGLLVCWPWATFCALLIFQASMRRAKVRTVHVLRTVLYTAGATVWLGLALLLAPVVSFVFAGVPAYDKDWLIFTCMLLMLAIAGLFTYHLTVAYRRYLQFDHAAATVIAAQFIVALAAFTALVNVVLL
jgi:hypothetical protein